MNLNPDAAAEATQLADLQRQIDVARERLLAHGRLVRPDNLRFPALANNHLRWHRLSSACGLGTNR
jgi:hypothetical protein